MLKSLAIVAGFAAVMLWSAIGFAQTAYSITDLGNLGYSSYPASINSSGQIVGTSYSNSSESYQYQYAFLYDASSTGSKTMIPLFSNGTTAQPSNSAYGINDSGQIVGSILDSYNSAGGTVYQYDAYTASLSAGQFTPISFNAAASTTGWINIGGGYTGSASAATAINNFGVIAGTALLPSDSANTQYGFTYDPNASTYSVFPNPTAAYGSGVVVSNNGINASGVVVGTWSTSTNASTAVNLAYYYDPSTGTVNQIHTPLDNTTTGLSYPCDGNGINDSGQVVGGGYVSTTGNGAFHAYRFDINGSGAFVDLGALSSGNYSEAQGINSAGEIVGLSNLSSGGSTLHAFVYTTSGQMEDLNSLIPATSGWTLEDATAVNASGWIVGFGVNSAGATDGFLLEPGAVVNNPGDVNGDGRVDINDLTTVLSNYGKSGQVWSEGNMDGDPNGVVDINDLTIVLSDFGTTYFTASPRAVPEPASVLMLAAVGLVPLAGWGIARRRARRR